MVSTKRDPSRCQAASQHALPRSTRSRLFTPSALSIGALTAPYKFDAQSGRSSLDHPLPVMKAMDHHENKWITVKTYENLHQNLHGVVTWHGATPPRPSFAPFAAIRSRSMRDGMDRPWANMGEHMGLTRLSGG